MISACNALAPGPGNRGPLRISFGRFAAFKPLSLPEIMTTARGELSRAAGLITFQDLFQELAGVGVGDLG
jgi:hypothetical protein